MCILFIYLGHNDVDSDYSLILVSNRDEYYDRPAQNMVPWSEDPHVIGGRDLGAEGGGTWMAVSPLRKKLGILLNLPSSPKPNAKSRGKIVADFVKSEKTASEYVESIKNDVKDCNEFVLVTVEFGTSNVAVQSYSNATEQFDKWSNTYLGFGNSLPEVSLKKVEAGKSKLNDVCSRLNKVNMKNQLIEELVDLLKSNERHLPDPELERTRPNLYKQLSSIYVAIPEGRYGTRTHTIVLVAKTGHVDIIEITMQAPVDPLNPKWEKSEFQCSI